MSEEKRDVRRVAEGPTSWSSKGLFHQGRDTVQPGLAWQARRDCRGDGSVIFTPRTRVDPSSGIRQRHRLFRRTRGGVVADRNDAVAQSTDYDGELDDLKTLFHGKDFNGVRFRLKVFWCSFMRDDPALKKKQRAALSWPQRLDLCRRALGPQYVVETLLDSRKPVTAETIWKLEECYRFQEGVVMLVDGVIRKDKAIRPVDMELVAVGLTEMNSVRLPTHFFWAVSDAGAYVVPLVLDRTFLFQAGRATKGKIELSVDMFVKQGDRFRCLADNFQADAFNALFALMGDRFVKPSKLTDHEAVLPNGTTVVIGKNRSIKFTDTLEIKFLARPARGVVGCNELWMTGKPPYTVAGVHFQAAQFLATASYGSDVHRRLLSNPHPTPAAAIVAFATEASLDLHEYAAAVYGSRDVNLIYGDEQWSDVSTPRSDTTSDAERRELIDGESDPEPPLQDVKARRAAINARKEVMLAIKRGRFQ